MMKANHRYTFTAIFLCTLINQSSQFKRCAEKATSNQTRDSSESCIAAGGNSLMVHHLQPIVKLSELDDSVCNRIRPLNVFLCEVYRTLPNDYQLSWYVNINGAISEDLVFFKSDLDNTGYFLRSETISGLKLTASTRLERNKTQCTEPILISALTVHPDPLTNNITKNFSVSCVFDYISVTNPLNLTISGFTHHDLTAEPPPVPQPKNLQLQCQYCSDSHCTVTVTWSPPENEDCIAFYEAIITVDNTTEHTGIAVAKSSLDFKQANYSHTAVLPRESYNATVTAENICGLRSEAVTLTLSKMMCAVNVCPIATCSGTKVHDKNIINTLLVLCSILITGLCCIWSVYHNY